MNIPTQQKQIFNEMKRTKQEQKYLQQQHYWQDKNGEWRVWLTDPDGNRKQKKRKHKEDLEQDIINWSKNNDKRFKDICFAWLDEKLEFEEIYKQSYDKYHADYKRFFSGTDFEKELISDITEDELEYFIKRRIKDLNLSRKVYSSMRTLLRGTFRYAKRKKYECIDIIEFFNYLDLSRKMFKRTNHTAEESVFTDKEFRLIYDYIMNEDFTIINLGILLAFYTGLRSGELAALQWSDVQDDVLSITKTEIRYRNEENKLVYEVRDNTKTEAGMRKVVINEGAKELLKMIRSINPFGEYMFMKNGKRITVKAFASKLYRICDKLGIEKRSMHKLRKTYATKLINAGVDESIIIAQMGHTDIECTKNFYYFNNKDEDEMKKQINGAVNY